MTTFSRPRPQPDWLSQYRLGYVAAATTLGLGFLTALAGIAVHNDVIANTGLSFMVAAVMVCLTALFVHGTWEMQQPISGRVVERFTEISGFTPNELPHRVTFDEILDPESDIPALTHRVTLYWLYVAPFNGGAAHWFLVNREVFDAHPVSADYDAANPATKVTSEVLVRSVPAEQREERQQVAQRDEPVDE